MAALVLMRPFDLADLIEQPLFESARAFGIHTPKQKTASRKGTAVAVDRKALTAYYGVNCIVNPFRRNRKSLREIPRRSSNLSYTQEKKMGDVSHSVARFGHESSPLVTGCSPGR